MTDTMEELENMAVLCNAIADKLSQISKQIDEKKSGCDWRFYTAMKEIYSLSFRPENSRPEYAAETIGAICMIAEKAFSSKQGQRNCDIYDDVEAAVKACHEDRGYCKSPIDERRSVISFMLSKNDASNGSRMENTKGNAAGNKYGKIFRRVRTFLYRIKKYSKKIIATKIKILIGPCPKTAIFL